MQFSILGIPSFLLFYHLNLTFIQDPVNVLPSLWSQPKSSQTTMNFRTPLSLTVYTLTWNLTAAKAALQTSLRTGPTSPVTLLQTLGWQWSRCMYLCHHWIEHNIWPWRLLLKFKVRIRTWPPSLFFVSNFLFWGPFHCAGSRIPRMSMTSKISMMDVVKFKVISWSNDHLKPEASNLCF